MNGLIERVEQFGRPRIALVGDFLLDWYVYGDAERISQEAPVPVLRIVRRESQAGGAGNVAAAVAALGGQVACIGVIGDDPPGAEMDQMLADAGTDTTGLVRTAGRRTAVKTRFVGLAQHRHQQQLFRADDEQSAELPDALRADLRQALADRLADCDLVALEDYNKGVLDDAHTPQLIADARAAGKAVLVDPAMIDNYARYRGATCLTPNRYEAALASGIEITDTESMDAAGRVLLEQTGAEMLAITMDKEGIYLLPADGPGRQVPQRPRSVYDVMGAGDQVLAMIAVAAAEGCDWDQAAALANVAGGLEVEHFGIVPISREEVLMELGRMVGLRASKVLGRGILAREISRRRGQGQAVVFTNGCFDLLHMGHVRYLQQARELGDALIVATNSDQSVARLKGPSRPVIGQRERAEMLAALECVDYVTIFDEDTPKALLELLRPDVLVKGGTTDVVVGREIVTGYGGQVLTLPAVEGLSTTEIINRITETRQP
jgi:D-beta-D-heptose 7-phosphate kinase/D-beta-D-heptose 1-phosphate adenosyltransferase